MGVRRTWYIDDRVDEVLHKIKAEKNLKTMNEVLEYILFRSDSFNNEDYDFKKKMNIMDKNLCIILEMLTMQLDTQGLVPNFSYTENLSTSYNAAKQLVENAIEEQVKNKREEKFFD
ncbi:hypothetical protein ETI05_10575 [Macrococcoides canis]|uniref:hypothetical protein n=1 Tax=Macrococcoides canis TaxID=1855823 RepID=UPI00105BE280|nr:hypothetical protein [Macrococcus canis]TDM19619.1 hypothetical protein ETI05_10575 [Macrococcus canis]